MTIDEAFAATRPRLNLVRTGLFCTMTMRYDL